MTTRRPPSRSRKRGLLAELERGLTPVARPNILGLLWRWRYELAIFLGLPAVLGIVISALGWQWTIVCASVTATILASWPGAGSWVGAHARCVITAHRVRAGCAQAWIHTRRGKLPIVMLTSPRPYGERVHLWCPAGICLEDFEEARSILCAACWARDIHVTCNARYSHIVILDVIRRDVLY